MSSSIILGLLRFLPIALEAGLPIVVQLVQQVTEKSAAKTDVEKFAVKLLELIPTMIAAGVAVDAVISVVKKTNDQVGVMIRESRGPTAEERTAQDARLQTLDDRLDVAAKPRP